MPCEEKRLSPPEHCFACHSTVVHFLGRKGGGDIYSCDSCGHGFVHPLMAEWKVSEYYKTRYYAQRGHEGGTFLRWFGRTHRYSELRRAMRKNLLNAGTGVRRVLEIGCGEGDLLERCKKAGIVCVGVEPAEAERECCRMKGLDVESTLDAVALRGFPPFDVVVLWHVIEHTVDPARLLKNLLMMVKDSSILVIATPNFSSVDRVIAGIGWEWLSPPSHLHFFSRQSLGMVLSYPGFTVVESHTRRGDAGNVVYGFLFGLAFRIRRLSKGPTVGSNSEDPTASSPKRFFRLRLLVNYTTLPLHWLLLPLLLACNPLGHGPEMVVTAKRVESE
jgi:SAM-dependent methyltransferase